eukprot:TRINITY_DN74172_c0_g1_i1.p1 TRINITY_DN74172_c0_g1~~TRINITY_DN74172_c0_g1_i1.p1  ORF type:complete len:413 (+),score=85.84 TRINITY_DN74172_c0_g1_i1:145-1383(+)
MAASAQAPSGSEGDDCDSEDASLSEGASSASEGPTMRNVRGRLRPVEANRRMSPLDVHFSQMRARERFRCESLIEDTLSQIRKVPLETAQRALEEAPPSEELLAEETAALQGRGRRVEERKTWLLEAPFPAIEVLKWRCKLRDEETGRPKVDEDTGLELYDAKDRWFSLDNRRLYCLQQAAVEVWPDRCLIDVIELPEGPLSRSRELRKFRTLDRGRSVFIGSRGAGQELECWSWREKVGIEKVDGEADGVAVASRRRPPAPGAGAQAHLRERQLNQGRGGGGSGAAPGPPRQRLSSGSGGGGRGALRREEGSSEAGEPDSAVGGLIKRFGGTQASSILVFVAIYVGLRLLFKVGQAGMRNAQTSSGGLPGMGEHVKLIVDGVGSTYWIGLAVLAAGLAGALVMQGAAKTKP